MFSRVVDSAELNVEICEEESESIPPLDTWISKIKVKYFEILSKVTSLFYKATKIEYTGKPLKTEKIVKTDIVIMSAIVIIYAIIAYVNLGSLKNPQTFYQPESPNETVQIDLGSVQSIDTVTYYLGIGDVATKPGMKLSYSKDGRTWQDMNVNCQLNSVLNGKCQTCLSC